MGWRRTTMRFISTSIFVLFMAVNCHAGLIQAQARPPDRPRVVITADPELDDNNTLIRAVLYSTDFDVEGLVYASSGVHWRGDGKGSTQYWPGSEYSRLGMCLAGCTSWRWPAANKEKFIDQIVEAYANVYSNLKVHNSAYPDPTILRSKIKWGNVDFEGDYSKDTDGSNLIKDLLLDDEPRPLYVTAQAGQSTIARALKSIYDQHHTSPHWIDIKNKVSHRLIIIPWGDQDGTYAKYIKPNWPTVSNWQLAMIEYGYFIRNDLAAVDQVYISGAWTRQNILNAGPLGALYRVWGDGKRMVEGDPTDYFGLTGYSVDQLREMGYAPFTPPQEKDSFISEGDTPTFLNLLNNGLRASTDGHWGGWGGIQRENAQAIAWGDTQPVGPDAPGVAPGIAPAGVKNPSAPGSSAGGQKKPAASTSGFSFHRNIPPRTAMVNARFFAAAQNDFAARLRWSVTPKYEGANHEPKVSIAGPMELSAKAGSSVRLQAQVSDPDRNSVRVTWWQYNDASTYPGDIRLSDPSSLATTFQVPPDAKPGETIHIILEATDDGEPPLTRYKRVVVTVR